MFPASPKSPLTKTEDRTDLTVGSVTPSVLPVSTSQSGMSWSPAYIPHLVGTEKCFIGGSAKAPIYDCVNTSSDLEHCQFRPVKLDQATSCH